MNKSMNRRAFAVSATTGLLATGTALSLRAQDDTNLKEDKPERMPTETEFTRDYPPPKFKPSWKNPQINRQMVQDFVIYAHSDLKMVEKLLDREPNLINSTMDWGNGDWETALGGASHMGRKDIVKYLLSKRHRIDIFCAAMMGMLGVVKSMIELEPALIDTRGPHGFNLHFHAMVGQEDAQEVLDYLQSIKKVELKPPPFLKQKKADKK